MACERWFRKLACWSRPVSLCVLRRVWLESRSILSCMLCHVTICGPRRTKQIVTDVASIWYVFEQRTRLDSKASTIGCRLENGLFEKLSIGTLLHCGHEESIQPPLPIMKLSPRKNGIICVCFIRPEICTLNKSFKTFILNACSFHFPAHILFL